MPRMVFAGPDPPQWKLLLAADRRVDPEKIRRVFVRFDEIRRHTTYYRSFEDFLVENGRYMGVEKIRELDRVGAVVLERGVWAGAFYKGSRCTYGNSITLVLIEHIFPKTDTKYASQLDIPLAPEVATTQTPLVRSTIWPTSEFAGEYLGIPDGSVRNLCSTRAYGAIRMFRHESGLLFQIEAHRCHSAECLALIRSGTWEFWVPEGEHVSTYWGTEYDPTTIYPGLGRPRNLTAQRKNRQDRHRDEKRKLIAALDDDADQITEEDSDRYIFVLWRPPIM